MEIFKWEDVTIRQYNEIVAVSQMRIDDLDKCLHVLSVLTGIEYEAYLDYPISQVEQEIKRINEISSGVPKPRFDGKAVYQVNGKKYKLTLSAKHMTAGQFIDYNNTIDNTPLDIALLCAIFLIPDGKKYSEGYDVLELRDEINDHFKIVDAMGISFFSEIARGIIRSYPTLFSQDAEKREEEDESIPGKSKSDRERPTDNTVTYTWERIDKQVIQYTRLNLYEVFNMYVTEYLNIATFCKVEILEHNKRQRERLSQLKRRR